MQIRLGYNRPLKVWYDNIHSCGGASSFRPQVHAEDIAEPSARVRTQQAIKLISLQRTEPSQNGLQRQPIRRIVERVGL